MSRAIELAEEAERLSAEATAERWETRTSGSFQAIFSGDQQVSGWGAFKRAEDLVLTCRSRTLVPEMAAELRNEHARVSFAQDQVANQRRELATLNEQAHRRNLELDALHFVWCDGGCEGGAHRFTEDTVTPEIVAEAIRNTSRLLSWFVNREGRKAPTDWESRTKAWTEAKARVTNAITEQQAAQIEALTAELAPHALPGESPLETLRRVLRKPSEEELAGEAKRAYPDAPEGWDSEQRDVEENRIGYIAGALRKGVPR